MELLSTVPWGDWAYLIVGVVSALLGYLSQKDKLPTWASGWLKKIGQGRVIDAINHASSFADLSPAQKQVVAREYLQAIVKRELGFEVPDRIANFIIEFIYNQIKRLKK